MNFVKKLKNIVNDIIPNEIKNNDYVKAALLAAGAYYGYGAAPQSFKDLFKPGPTSLVSRGKGFLFGEPSKVVEMALAQLVNSKNFLQAMNGNIPMDFIQPGSPSGPTVSIGSTGGTDIT